MKSAIVLTSIHDCTELLNGYLANIAKYGHDTTIFLIPDRKTPKQNLPIEVKCPSIPDQENILIGFGFPHIDIPFNSDNRRNVGYLMALADGAEMIVSIDDDNHCQEDEDFIGTHSKAMTRSDWCLSTDSGWYNNCNLLRPSTNIYPRGFPYYAREKATYDVREKEREIVRINAGMWAGDPDADAITWLSNPYKSQTSFGSVVLAPDTWCPINSQNTAVHRDFIPAYYFVRMTPPIDRFGDIFQGYFALKVAKHLGFTARFGTPVVTHRRNSHNYLKDAQAEIPGMILLEEFLPKLIECHLDGTTVTDSYLSLAEFVGSGCTMKGLDGQFYAETAHLMRLWAKSCTLIG
jgi:hypothetical protein